MRRTTASTLAVAAALVLIPGAASAIVANCRNSGNFQRWLAEFKKEAIAQGVSRRTIAAAAPLLTYSQRIINIDRGQRIFTLNFAQFAKRVIPKYRLQMGIKKIKQHAATFAKVERQYGVPAPVITAFWGLESDFGANMGKDRTLPAVATLAYDCRRSERFREQLLGALRLIESGDLRPDQMIGSWAGELGQTQMMPAEYNQNAVDFDGDGKRDLLHSVPDVIASTANYLAKLGWQRGVPWLEEVRAPRNLPWDQADLSIQHPRSQWAKWGVRRTHGKKLPSDNVKASLILPMGRLGPAFLAYDNFQVYLKWNESLVYSTTAAFFATRLAGAPAMRSAANIPGLSYEQIHELQRLLARKGHDVGKIDGIIGANTRAAVKKVQMQLGLPADSWPTPELLARLRGSR